jgi:hypothetical protein
MPSPQPCSWQSGRHVAPGSLLLGWVHPTGSAVGSVPQSQPSPTAVSVMAFPHSSVESQLALHPSPETVLPSSHTSPGSRTPLPQPLGTQIGPSHTPAGVPGYEHGSPKPRPSHADSCSGSTHRSPKHRVPAGHKNPSAQNSVCGSTHPLVPSIPSARPPRTACRTVREYTPSGNRTRGWARVLAGYAGCSPAAVFSCASDDQCGEEGRCEAMGYCSFPDPECGSGRRYGSLSGPDVAGSCVPVDDAVDDATSTIDGSPTDDSTPSPTSASRGLAFLRNGNGRRIVGASVDQRRGFAGRDSHLQVEVAVSVQPLHLVFTRRSHGVEVRARRSRSCPELRGGLHRTVNCCSSVRLRAQAGDHTRAGVPVASGFARRQRYRPDQRLRRALSSASGTAITGTGRRSCVRRERRSSRPNRARQSSTRVAARTRRSRPPRSCNPA